MKLTFYGGAGMVTGANYLLESGDTKILVDCGLNQGGRYCEELNFEDFPYSLKDIAAIFVTHAHIDHIGRIPKLYRDGFRGAIYSTPPTHDFAEFLLIDSEHILTMEARDQTKPPIYTADDVHGAMELWRSVPYHRPVTVGDFSVELVDAGHVLGSSSVVVSAEGKKIVFSGDLGNTPAPFIRPTEYVHDADFALIESAYGGRVHEDVSRRKDLVEDAIEATAKAGGTLMIPAFALERTQEMIFVINELIENGRIPRLPVFIDSPLAIHLTGIYRKYAHDPEFFNKEAIELLRSGDAIFDFPGLRMTLTTQQSKDINDVSPPKVVMAGAGMSNGGRILHHERRYLSDSKSTLLIVGYQAEGSLGRRILNGEKQVKVLGEEVPVRCRVTAIGGYSAHADQPQLLSWASASRGSLKKVFVVQGDQDQSEVLATKIRDSLTVAAEVPSRGESVVL